MSEQQHSAVADDDGEQVVEIVSDTARELSHRLHLLGLAVLRLEPLAVSRVGNDAHDPAQLATASERALGDVDIAHGAVTTEALRLEVRDDRARLESRTVLGELLASILRNQNEQ